MFERIRNFLTVESASERAARKVCEMIMSQPDHIRIKAYSQIYYELLKELPDVAKALQKHHERHIL